LILSSAYLLVFHGSRDHKAQLAAFDLVKQLSVKFKSKHILTQHNYLENNFLTSKTSNGLANYPLIEVAALELTSISLRERLVVFAQKAYREGYCKVKVLPLFLAPGVHVQEDIPTEITAAIKKINNKLTVELSPYLGKYSGIVTLLSREFSKLSAETRILIAHGSRLPLVAEYYQNLANHLGTAMAYWSMNPGLEEQILKQIKLGKSKIAIVPYFLFPGKITKAIAAQITQLQQAYPQVKLSMGKPLGATTALAELIFETESK